MTVTLIALVLLAVVAYPLFDFPVRLVDRYVAVVDARDTDTETRQEIKLYMKSGAVFSLAHVEDADPKTGAGICLGAHQQAWLREFRAAISNCLAEAKKSNGEDPAPLVFKVRGYASIAPMDIGGDISESARLNCKVANQRAAAVGAFLIDPNNEEHEKWWSCDDVWMDFNREPPTATRECGELYEAPDQSDDPFRVKVHQWSDPSDMIANKPAHDGKRPKPRRFDVEILNRVVHIGVPLGFCGPPPSEAATS